ncbi:hypothetical protein MLD38_016878 [Melastoma candidum]|uniref:Uncharacterized protein n=1 Tax=Melastoma candidum TaxID=119954 RepID=A0ACB9QNU5_9MYRT|nr:hypothetical protein MLD38_016878 [Melastoma candidum]
MGWETFKHHQRHSSSPASPVSRDARGPTPGFRGKKKRCGFSDPIPSHELNALKYEAGAELEGVEEFPEYVEDSPRLGALDDCSVGLESDSFSSSPSTSNSGCRTCSKDANNNRWHSFIHNLKKGPAARFNTIPLKKGPKLTRRKSTRIRGELVPAFAASLDTEWSYFKPSWKNFSFDELQDVTNNFSHENLIGEGGCAQVYNGLLPDGQHVAIKRLKKGTPEEMTADFLSELGIIVHVDHPNIAKLIGYGVEGGMFIVLHLSPHGSLATFLYGSKEKLNWSIRFKVALGTAEGLMYLHEDCQRRIIHRDIKAANILLSEDFEAQISDFGLAKWLPEQWTHHTVSHIEGTFGYLPPEYFMHGIVDEKTDVYAYGVLLLELITGRQALDSTQKSLVMWAKPLLATNNVKAIIDPSLNGVYDSEEMDRIVLVASLCINQSSVHRPEMSQIVRILRGDECCLDQAKKHKQPSLQRTYSEELYAAEEYNSTKYLSDMEKYMEIVLGKTTEEQS